MEQRVRAASQRLTELQSQATSVTEALVAQEEAKGVAEQQAQHAQAVVQVSCVVNKLGSTTVQCDCGPSGTRGGQGCGRAAGAARTGCGAAMV
jgi:hypothetical protein